MGDPTYSLPDRFFINNLQLATNGRRCVAFCGSIPLFVLRSQFATSSVASAAPAPFRVAAPHRDGCV